MTYFKDMTVCDYFGGRQDWLCRLMAIGWLERDREYSRGYTDPKLMDKLALLRREFGVQFPGIKFRGLHGCTLCATAGNSPVILKESHINLFIPTDGCVYVAPGRIDHYIQAHGYAPREHFVEAVLKCPSPASDEFRELLAKANRGYDAPLYAYKW